MNNKFKKATKRITAVAASAALVSASVFGSLGSYPNNFVSGGQFDGKVVVGAAADAMDGTSAASIIDDLKDEFSGGSEKVMITYKSSSEGGEELSVSRSNQALNYGEKISSVTESAGYGDKDADALADSRFDNGISDTDYTQSLLLKNGTFNYALKDNVDGVNKISDGIYYASGDEFAEYTLDLDSALNLSDSAFADDLVGNELNIMGNDFTIASVSKTTNNLNELVLVGGANKISVGEGESTTVTVDGTSYEISVQAVSDSSPDKVLLSVNGQSKSIDAYDTKDVGGITIAVTDLVPSSRDSVKGYAEFVVGGQKISLQEGDVEINDQNADDVYPDYNVDVDFRGSGMDKIVIKYSVDDDTLLQEGDSLVDVLFDSFRLEYRGTNEPDYSTIEVRSNDDDIKISGTTLSGESFNRNFLHMEDKTSADTGVWLRGEQDGDRIFFKNSQNLSGLNTTPNVLLSTPTAVNFSLDGSTVKGSGFLLQEDQEEQYLYEISKVDTSDSEHKVTLKEFLRGADESDIKINEWDSNLGTTLTVAKQDSTDVQIAITNLGNEIAFENEMMLTLNASAETQNIGDKAVSLSFLLDQSDVSADADAEEGDGVRLVFTYDATDYEFDISTPLSTQSGSSNRTFVNDKEEDNSESNSNTKTFVTTYGIMVEYDNEDKAWAKIMTPDEQVEASAYVVFGGASASTSSVTVDADMADDKVAELEDDGMTVVSRETMTAEEVEFDVSAAVLDSDVTGTSDMIVVGGPAVNRVAAELLGLAFPTYGSDSGVDMGEAVIRYFEDSNSVLVYGYSAEDTKAAADKLNAGGLSGNSVNV